MSRASSNVSAVCNENVSSDADEIVEFRSLWWEKGIFHPKAKWEEEKLPYTLVKSVSLEEYELRVDKFNVHGCWDWKENKVIVYEWPSKVHETIIGELTYQILRQFDAIHGTPAHMSSMGAVRTRADNTGHESDATFRPPKPPVRPPHGSDGEDEPWPNVVLEVAYSESEGDVLKKVQQFWLKNPSRVHDVIVVKIDYVAPGETPTRMQAWHFCVSDRTTRNADIVARTYFEFGTHDQNGRPLNIQQGTCVININLDCFYHGTFPRITIPRNQVPDPIQLDFLLLRNCFLRAFEKI
ncbi:uncharacterized protein OCT59_015326 [Rhizophagus irregularis]|uniref:Restriction endonuclease domain-containing protein n=1 Tax=Rhizophagus irregularis (strain DAOM 181602 / DAOM 197198 / MUCL 43194) TaxID=747089 RepID=A0A2P4QX37_RHIID|nr:hypothetical protein GLOIN_2v1499413 [Rhizophagus irregularis DAOM 181602=DAOM 197198]POG82165.1 hypothetical protein GLOIN_2v1499413 [Rhizophagus irregularis DAOM 181602=DAOM 197198]UZO22980.1 hypothetical protein OCT59_015326 [Rhizophagus irregularis]GBC18797.2 hypothetical protein GLOIN_2v1499413 [Rhizophagus irregularis DAOM 181602=DAOM 197198]|eukprot:XP_025189031.1 hypothetical protein GLOIN_2v1499413 [Rhizophagus irregularis DAOM 181602=DAOM 197198]